MSASREDDVILTKVVEIAQDQAASNTAMAELHRQNVSKLDTMATLLSAQTTSIVAMNTAQAHMMEEQKRDQAATSKERAEAVDAIKKHITTEVETHFKDMVPRLEFYNKPAWWLSIGILFVGLVLNKLSDLVKMVK